MTRDAVAQVEAAVERMCSRQDVSAARARQLRWVAKELRLVGAHPEFRPGTEVRAAADLLGAQALTSYLRLARDGQLRQRPTSSGDGTSSTSSMRIREDCLRLICRELSLPLVLSERAPLPEPREVVNGPTRSQLRAYLAEKAKSPPTRPGRIRLLAIIGTVLDTAARVGELCALRVTDLDLSGSEPVLTIVRHPQARSVSEPVTERIVLSPGTAVALRHWLATREQILVPLQIGVKSLWVSVAGNHAGLPAADGHSIKRPAGMPLRPRGLQRAYTRTVVELNTELAGSPGWRPLPYRLEQLRRAVEVTPDRLVGSDQDPLPAREGD
ncbi:site-specific integrase [Actinocrinis puniceicyclus]|uniref:Site-specific integrase n=1 Tax=Actinocrinis puniceicyclus TaxID=977794 RepID=A0A8J7WIQ3_9ACTN|nr:site-specific integrase [Actinocrinis puniceicyclus]MBS2962998.1 site-specific integrase [Actinocrinis puniceicyclus]